MDATTNRLVNKTLVPAWTFDIRTGTYRHTQSGQVLTPTELRRAVELVISGAKGEAHTLVNRLHGGELTLDQWSAAMMMLVEALHRATAAAASAGIPALADATRTDLEATLARERMYVQGFRNEIGATLAGVGATALGMTLVSGMTGGWQSRAASYMDAALMTYERNRYRAHLFMGYTEAQRVTHPTADHCPGCMEEAEKGWVPIEDLVLLGDEECGQWCYCTVEYRRAPAPNVVVTGVPQQ